MSISFVSFPDIESFHNIIKAISVYPHLATGPVTYRGKIKIHGTCAGLQIKDGEIAAQSRTQIITPANDNVGFAQWVENKSDYFKALSVLRNNCTIFGEWSGPGIQKNTAINKIPNKIFAVFAIMESIGESAIVISDPVQIKEYIGTPPSDMHILPWYGEEFTVDLHNRDTLQPVVDTLNKVIETIEPSDPWVKETFGVDGTAEGVVYYPGAGKVITRKTFSDLVFKAKGEKHKVVKTKLSVQIDPEVAASVDEFVKIFVTEPRLEQGLTVVGGVDMKNIPAFLKWMGLDILKESADELEVSGLEWSQVVKSIQHAARNWYILKCQKI